MQLGGESKCPCSCQNRGPRPSIFFLKSQAGPRLHVLSCGIGFSMQFLSQPARTKSLCLLWRIGNGRVTTSAACPRFFVVVCVCVCLFGLADGSCFRAANTGLLRQGLFGFEAGRAGAPSTTARPAGGPRLAGWESVCDPWDLPENIYFIFGACPHMVYLSRKKVERKGGLGSLA